MKRSVVVVSILCALPAFSQSGTTGLSGLRAVEHPEVISLDDAFRRASERSTDLRVTQARLSESKANVTQAWASVLPNVSLKADYTYSFPEQEAQLGSPDQFTQQALLFDSIANITDASAAQNPDPVARRAAAEQAAALRQTAKDLRSSEVPSFVLSPAHQVGGNITFAMPLFNGRAFPLLQNAYSAVELTRLSSQQAKAAVLWGVARTYYAVAGTKQLVQTASEQVESTKRHLTTTQQRHELGYVTDLAVDRAVLEVKKAEQQERQARGGLRAAKAGLAGLLGIVDDFDVDAPPPVAALNESVPFEALLERARDARVDLRVQKQLLAIADRNKQDAWLRFLPSFQLIAQGRYTSNTAGLTSQPLTGAVIVQGTLPLYDGGQTFGAIDGADAKLTQELLRTRQLEENIERELRGTLDDLALKKENVTTTSEVAVLAKKTADNAEALYGEGAITQSDVTDARLGAFAASVEATRATLDLETARIGLAYSIGELASYIKSNDIEPAPLSDDEAAKARATLDRLP
ncbi:MAG: TolC family protein [Deltaproteobacteria bacterium]|nr:TolC family protein [Deltaproteobacteria bacterium]